MVKDLQTKKLMGLVEKAVSMYGSDSRQITDYLISKGVSCPLAVVGDELFVIMVKKAPGEGRYNRGFMATSPLHLTLDADFEVVKKTCVKSDIQLLGRLAFGTYEEAESALRSARAKK